MRVPTPFGVYQNVYTEAAPRHSEATFARFGKLLEFGRYVIFPRNSPTHLGGTFAHSDFGFGICKNACLRLFYMHGWPGGSGLGQKKPEGLSLGLHFGLGSSFVFLTPIFGAGLAPPRFSYLSNIRCKRARLWYCSIYSFNISLWEVL